jgi:hypothetical protein
VFWTPAGCQLQASPSIHTHYAPNCFQSKKCSFMPPFLYKYLCSILKSQTGNTSGKKNPSFFSLSVRKGKMKRFILATSHLWQNFNKKLTHIFFLSLFFVLIISDGQPRVLCQPRCGNLLKHESGYAWGRVSVRFLNPISHGHFYLHLLTAQGYMWPEF